MTLTSALEFLSTCKLSNLTVKAELGCCLLHRSGKLIIDCCFLQCESNPLDYLSYAIISTSNCPKIAPSLLKCCGDGVSVSETRIEGGAKAVLTSGSLALQRVRVIYAQTSILFWFDVEHQQRWSHPNCSVVHYVFSFPWSCMQCTGNSSIVLQMYIYLCLPFNHFQVFSLVVFVFLCIIK